MYIEIEMKISIMILLWIALNLLVFYKGLGCRCLEGSNVNLGEALQFLREYDREASFVYSRTLMAQWNFATNITDNNRRNMLEEQMRKLKFERISWRNAINFAWTRIPDPLVRRQLKMMTIKGRNALPEDEFNELHHLIVEMKELYFRTRLCPYKKMEFTCNLDIDGDITRIMAKSRDYEELLYYWRTWQEAVGPPMKNKYMRYIQLANQAAKLNGFSDAGDQMCEIYEDDYFHQHIADVISAITPLYKNLFTYVRSKLIERYGDKIRTNGPLPAHLLGNMWAQNWENIYDLVKPFPGVRQSDVTLEMTIQGFTPLRMFQMAEEYFTSLGMKPMPPEFWRYSIFEKPIDREIKCTASAWDFCNGIDFRIKQCSGITIEDLITAHHEMAHIQYYLQYKDQPLIFRNEPIPGFHEAVSDSIVLSVMNPRHLQRIGLNNSFTENYESNINYLMLIALQKVVYLPFAYIVDQWRWRVYSDGIANMTSLWWELRLQYQGIVPPVPRVERDFDPGSKYHIPADISYTKYFVGVVLQFQLFESLCEISGHVGDLYLCDLYRSQEAGRLLTEILSYGSSRSWQHILRTMTRGKMEQIDVGALLRYFDPLYKWLQRQNQLEPVIGWITNGDDTTLFAHWFGNCSSVHYVQNVFFFILVIGWYLFRWQ